MLASECNTSEYTASEIRKLLQELFPFRRLVLSQFTFFNQVGVAKPTGETFRRKRRCYRLMDVLSIACVLALKEQGIPLKNICDVPNLIQAHAAQIFKTGRGCRLFGMGDAIHLQMPGVDSRNAALLSLLGDNSAHTETATSSEGITLESSSTSISGIFWGFDVGELADQIQSIAGRVYGGLQRAA